MQQNQKFCEKLQKQFEEAINLDLDSNFRLLKPLIKKEQNNGKGYFTLPSTDKEYLENFQKILDKAKQNNCDLMTKFQRNDVKNLKEIYLSSFNDNKIFVSLDNKKLIPSDVTFIDHDQVRRESMVTNSVARQNQSSLVWREMQLMHVCQKYGNNKQECFKLLPYLLTC
jgi:hypothetical protein